MAVIPEEVCGVADVQPASDADHSTESVGIVEWVELTALTGVGAAVLVLQQRKRNLAPLRREAHTVV